MVPTSTNVSPAEMKESLLLMMDLRQRHMDEVRSRIQTASQIKAKLFPVMPFEINLIGMIAHGLNEAIFTGVTEETIISPRTAEGIVKAYLAWSSGLGYGYTKQDLEEYIAAATVYMIPCDDTDDPVVFALAWASKVCELAKRGAHRISTLTEHPAAIDELIRETRTPGIYRTLFLAESLEVVDQAEESSITQQLFSPENYLDQLREDLAREAEAEVKRIWGTAAEIHIPALSDMSMLTTSPK